MKGIDITSSRIEQFISVTPPSFIGIKEDSVEYSFGFPNMMNTLWGYICTFHRFPIKAEFLEYYMRSHSESLLQFREVAVKARVLRSYRHKEQPNLLDLRLDLSCCL
jgi:hypothetical protein